MLQDNWLWPPSSSLEPFPPQVFPLGGFAGGPGLQGQCGGHTLRGAVECLWGWSAGHLQSSSYPWHPAPVAMTLRVRGQVWTSARPVGSDPEVCAQPRRDQSPEHSQSLFTECSSKFDNS